MMNKKVKITADSTCDLPKELLKEFAFDTVPLTVTLGDKDYSDGVDITPQMIYDYVAKTGVLPKTAAPSPEFYRTFFQRFTNEYDAVIHFNISSCVSASNQNAKLAALDFKNVYVVDSQVLSTGTAVEMLFARDLLEAGNSVEDTLKTVAERINCVQTSFVVERLEYLHMGGRCSLMQRFGANLLKLRPFIFMWNGELGVEGKFRGVMKVALVKYIEELAKRYPNHESKRAFLTHTNCDPEVVAEVKKAIESNFRFENVYETIAGSTITSHCGQGTLGLLFLNDAPVK